MEGKEILLLVLETGGEIQIFCEADKKRADLFIIS